MLAKTLAIALAFSSAVSAAPALQARQDKCQDAYKSCIAAGTPEVACSCTLAACVGEDNARNREFCASATASLKQPAPTTFSSVVRSTPVPTSVPGGCNPAHPGSCPTPSAASSVKPASSAKATPSAKPAPAPAPAPAPGSNPVKVDGKKWTVANLSRYCSEDNTGCDYNFDLVANGKTQHCTVIRDPGSSAATESWSNLPCTKGSEYTLSWGYAPNPAPAFAVLTVVDKTELAWFGVPDVNGQKVTVTPSNPFGSGQWKNITEQVFTY